MIASNGLVRGATKSEELATKLIDFLSQLQSLILNDFTMSCSNNMHLMKKIIEMTTVKFIQDKGRQERTMAMILSFIFGSCLKNDEEKSLFNQLLKKIFEFEPNSLMEELISNLLKEKINQLGLKSNQNQLQRVLNTYLDL